mmetsp:Transcript_30117/g.82750  ORF Transcript_30117/g.82750 Transcript_30117/m.82750 type:complete len:368 (-) Transcript_30117:86-1189(-)|eukprot:CAMPEP_0168752286 /NCGR_PEP_ID=MMETSP0724-20121128/18304_1 /TAXON_ID=265536 /ORGANISM="Amphiprora sp., Strain CCMP467" /LENGTH=367 /DNA_ID=CAMNT_0008800523 /DNA_START=40 /DNA_END=1143 /DNA_ORIENTATION=+
MKDHAMIAVLYRLLLAVTIIATSFGPVHAFVSSPSQLLSPPSKRLIASPRSAVVCRISNIFGKEESKQSSLPKDVKEAVNRCREATQEALKSQKSRMDIEFPVGTKFSVEPTPKKKNKGKDASPISPLDLERSNRELARLYVDMFQPVGGDRIAVVFNEVEQADAAKQKWKSDATAQSVILSMDRRKSRPGKRKAPKKRGFAAKLAQELSDDNVAQTGKATSGPFRLPDNTEVALFVAPGPKELIMVEKICEQVGMGTLVVLLNARTALIESWGSEAAENLFRREFESVFHLGAAPQAAAPNCLLFHSYPGNWVMARKPAVGAPQTIQTFDHRPSPEECHEAFDKVEISPVEQKVEGALEGVASWFS